MINKVKSIYEENANIKERNRRVEINKAWETSISRKVLIVILTYIVIVIFFYFAGLPKPLINSIVPALAFFLSTLSLDYFKRIWIKHIYKRK